MATTRSRPHGREHARPSSGGVVSEHATKIFGVAAASIVVTVAFLALTGTGHVIDAATQHFMLFYAGVFALIALSASVGLGLAATHRMFLSPGRRVFVQSAHRAASFGAVTFLVVHIVTEILAQRVHVLDAVIPFLSPFRTFYIGLGTIASDLIILLVITGIMRGRFNANGKAWRWRAIHYVSYLSFVFGIWHGLLGGRPGKPYVDWSYGLIAALVAIGLAVRVLSSSLRPPESLSGSPVPAGASSASAPMRAAAMFAQLGAARAAQPGRHVLSVTSEPVLSAPVPLASTTVPMLTAPVARVADARPPSRPAPAGQVQAGPKYEPGYEGPPRYLGTPRDLGTGPMPRITAGPLSRAGSGPMPRAATGPMPQAGTGPMASAGGYRPADGPGFWPQSDDGYLSNWGSGHQPAAPTGPQPRMTGPFPRPGAGSMPRVASSGPMPRAGAGPLPRADPGPVPRSVTGPMPRPATGPMPRPATGPMPRSATGPVPRSATGPMPRPATGPMPRSATGSQPRMPDDPYPRAGAGSVPRSATGPMPRAGTGPTGAVGGAAPRPAQGAPASGFFPRAGSAPRPGPAPGWQPRLAADPYPRPGSGPIPRAETGPFPRAGTGPVPRATGGQPRAARGPVQRPQTGPVPAVGRPLRQPDLGGPAGFRDQPGAGPAGFRGSTGRPGRPRGGRDDGRSGGPAPWDSGWSEPDPDFRYREPGPGMPGYRGSRDHRYGGDLR